MLSPGKDSNDQWIAFFRELAFQMAGKTGGPGVEMKTGRRGDPFSLHTSLQKTLKPVGLGMAGHAAILYELTLHDLRSHGFLFRGFRD